MKLRTRVPLLAMFVAVAAGGVLASAGSALATDYRVIPTSVARYMWQNGNGYCGECSLQIAGISRGFWVSQDQARKLAGSEALLGVNYDTMLNKLHLTHVNYSNSGSGATNRQNFLQWIRDGMAAGKPVIFCVKTHDTWGGDPDYDHIIIAHCVSGHASGYYGTDILRYSDHFDGVESSMTFDQWANGYNTPSQYYYLPQGTQYGTRITAMDGDSETLPISFTVPSQTEPNVTQGESPVSMSATVNMSGLTAGTTYSLLRWDATSSTITSVPFTNLLGNANPSNVEYQFTATGSTATRGVTFMSNGITVFRLVPGVVHGLNDGFEDGNLLGWTTAGNGVTVQSSKVQAGSYAASLKKTSSMTRPVNVSGQSTAALSFWVNSASLGSGKKIYAETSTNGTTWTTQYSGAPTSWTHGTYSVNVAGISTLYVRFRTDSTSSSRWGYVDTVSVQ